MISRVDRLAERVARGVARKLSRRGLVARIGALFGASAMPLLPVSRANAMTSKSGDASDPTSCSYWRYCGIDGFLCTCCGGSASSCPPGTEPSPITWVGTCRNPEDGLNYVISYNDCCGKSACGRCECYRNEGDTPVYQPQQANDLDWCLGTRSGVAYNCSTAVVLGVAE
ncbi:MAG: methylamine dehydrogenase light chain [Phenylobacterium sp.]|uniref:methylamine dehydrogenase light chain n=1 Tax=Phenylobacterium sp. TaxID=1871053 RepID=UPI0027323236|nr:methylamine dehydrogenase light chain [Phenylobacterium sp.]MDP3749565.1 methylamine dehydrogenase light chain [Phenylobacterium sp.]